MVARVGNDWRSTAEIAQQPGDGKYPGRYYFRARTVCPGPTVTQGVQSHINVCMGKAVSISTDVPADRRLQITLPPDVPIGPADLVIVVRARPVRGRPLRDLAESEFFGMWKDRDDIGDSVEFARRLRKSAWTRQR